MKFVPVRAWIALREGSHRVSGFAFEYARLPEFHLFVHRWPNGEWSVSHWESGRAVERYGRAFRSRAQAVRAALGYLDLLSLADLRAVIAPWRKP